MNSAALPILLQQRQTEALSLMSEAGFPIKEEVVFEVDAKLPFMGYTSEKNAKTLIVVSGWSLATGMSMGLIIHELSHVYRIETKHPSHNGTLHSEVIHDIFGDSSYPKYQVDAIYSIINNVQDIYADDISFKVYIKDTQKNINEFFLSWIKDPISPAHTEEERWKNAEFLLGATFAQANIVRHNAEDTNQKIEKSIERFLKNIDKPLAGKFDYFRDMMISFPEEITDQEFKPLLKEYISEFLKLTK